MGQVLGSLDNQLPQSRILKLLQRGNFDMPHHFPLPSQERFGIRKLRTVVEAQVNVLLVY